MLTGSRIVSEFLVGIETPFTVADVVEHFPKSTGKRVADLLKTEVKKGRINTKRLKVLGDVYWRPAPQPPTEVEDDVAIDRKLEETQLEQQIEDLLHVEEEYNSKVQVHIDRLHRYNDTKDACQLLLGKLSMMRGVTSASLYEEFGIPELANK